MVLELVKLVEGQGRTNTEAAPRNRRTGWGRRKTAATAATARPKEPTVTPQPAPQAVIPFDDQEAFQDF